MTSLHYDDPDLRASQPGQGRIPPGLMEDLRASFGARAQFGDDVRRHHGSSEAHFPVSLPDAVVFPTSTEEVVRLVKRCVTAEVPIVPFGAGTSLEGNAIPTRGGVSVDMSRMDAILEINEADCDCLVQAGVRRNQLNAHLRDQGLFFPVDPGADATIGGMAATRASGTNAVRYGTMRDAVLSLRAVMPDGTDIRTARRARKSAAGYDLTRLLVGSEGTLGIITEIALRLHPIPETISSATCSFETLEGAIETVVQSIQLGVPLARVELLDDVQMMAVNRWANMSYPEQTTLFFEFHGTSASVEEQVATVRGIASGNRGGEFQWSHLAEERTRLWNARHNAYYAAVNLRPGAVGLAIDVCVPIGRLAECIGETKRDLRAATVPGTILGHVGDGNFHVVFSIDPNEPGEMAEVESINRRLIERALAMDGTCTGEHGIGLGKREWLENEVGDTVRFMRMIKQAFDPANLFNPDKIFREPAS